MAMFRWTLFSLALASAGLGLLTVFKAPDWVSWKLVILAGEFGYWVALLPVAVAIAAGMAGRGTGPGTAATVALALAGALLLLQPCFQAWLIGRVLPADLERSLGRVSLARRPFAVRQLFGAAPEVVAKETFAYSGALQLDFYRAARRGSAPCVLVVHGGGWDDGERGQIPAFNFWLAAQGYAVADLSYRLAPQDRWPAPREDLTAAVAFVESRAQELGVDRSRLVILGRSAGGQIAEATAYPMRDPAIRGVVGLYAPADLNFAYAWAREDDALKSPHLLRQYLGGPPGAAAAAYASASAIGFVDAATPPTLLVHGRLDTLVWSRQSERLAARLAGVGVRHYFLSLPWATHAVEYNLNGPSGQLTAYALAWFLAAVTK
jgi:acetyl esterase/lipase